MSINLAGASGQPQEIETNSRAARAVLRPSDVGSLGSYKVSLISGSMAAGLAANAPAYSFRNNGSNYVLLRRLNAQAMSLGTGFTAGNALLAAYIARSWYGADSGGNTLTAGSGRAKGTHANQSATDIRISNTATLTGGTRTLDANPFAQLQGPVGAGTYAQFFARGNPILDTRPGDWPLILAPNEGVVIQATVPATGVWQFIVDAEWDEVSTYGTALAA